jgi:hypothetical protein
MKKLFILISFQLSCTAALSQSQASDEVVHFQRSNLDIQWKVPKHPWPKTFWTYKAVPTQFSTTVVSNVMALAPFTQGEKRHSDTNGFLAGHTDGSYPNLRVSFLAGEIEFNGPEHRYGPTNLAKDVPGTNRLVQLTTNFLPTLGIKLSEVARRENGELKIGWNNDDHTEYSTGNEIIANIEYRTVGVARALDGIEYPGADTMCRISFGEHGKVEKLWVHWHSVERDKLYEAATPKQMIQWIREGRAIQPRIMDWHNHTETMIDWSSVKSLTITNIEAKYNGPSFVEREFSHEPLFPAVIYPDAMLSGIVDTGKTKVNVVLICPVVDDSKPLN